MRPQPRASHDCRRGAAEGRVIHAQSSSLLPRGRDDDARRDPWHFRVHVDRHGGAIDESLSTAASRLGAGSAVPALVALLVLSLTGLVGVRVRRGR
jgi:hypothetical protein